MTSVFVSSLDKPMLFLYSIVAVVEIIMRETSGVERTAYRRSVSIVRSTNFYIGDRK